MRRQPINHRPTGISQPKQLRNFVEGFARGVITCMADVFIGPTLFSLLGQVSDSGTVLTQRPTLEFFLDFATRMLLAFGFVFELPLFISFLVIGGIVTPRQLLKFSRWAVVLAFVAGAIVTPGPEVTSQMAVSGALIGLYFLSLGIAYVLKPRARAKAKDPG